MGIFGPRGNSGRRVAGAFRQGCPLGAARSSGVAGESPYLLSSSSHVFASIGVWSRNGVERPPRVDVEVAEHSTRHFVEVVWPLRHFSTVSICPESHVCGLCTKQQMTTSFSV